MSLAREIRDILPDPTVLVSDSAQLSYVKCLLPRRKSYKMLLLHKELPPKNLQHKAFISDDLESSELDITGSPLLYELYSPVVDETIVDNKNWKKEEELYLSLAKFEASVALNCCLEYMSNKDCSLPLFAICDGKDNNKTVLLGSYTEYGWYTTIQVHLSDSQPLSNIEEIPAILLKEYTKMFSVPEHKVGMAVRSTYEVCGKRPGIMDLLDLSPGCFNGNLSIEVNWSTLSFYAPIRASTTTLVMEIIAGSSKSHLNELWKELMSLDQYLNMLGQCEYNSHTFSSSTSVTWDEIKGKLSSLLTGANENASYKDDDDNDHREVAHDIKLKKHIDNVQLRQNLDFVDMFWELLINCADYTQIKNCIHMVLQEIQLGLATPQITPTNTARIAKIISEILCQKGAMLGENSPLELLIDTGMEKLSRDYVYILSSANLSDFHDIPQILCNIQGGLFNIESYRKKLTSLVQIHLCLEFTLFAQNYLHCSTANLQPIFSYAFQEYVSKNPAIKSFPDPHENQIQCLNVPLPTIDVKHIVQGLPSSWCLSLSSESSYSRITTTSHLSRTPILPPNIYCFDDSSEHEVYHFLKLNASSAKIA